MTTLALESISKTELEKRLRTTDLISQVKETSKDKVISALLISFYFKGGNVALGCEFTHKAFREYLFAEEIVEALKSCARVLPENLPERPPSLYWRDYDDADPRKRWTSELAALLAPQWLVSDVIGHVESLLEWEISRSLSQALQPGDASATRPLAQAEWRRARTFLADLWDWWADGVHLRPQPRDDDDTGQVKWDPSLSERLVPRCRPLTSSVLGSLPEPVRTTTLDAHLGDAVFRVASAVHWHLQAVKHTAPELSRRYERVENAKVMFRPTGTNQAYFGVLCHRISAAGWRPRGAFPSGIRAKGADFSDTELKGLPFFDADMEGSSFQNARLLQSNFTFSNMKSCLFSRAFVAESSFVLANLESATFFGAHLLANRFNGALLSDASFVGVNWGAAMFYAGPSTSDGCLLPPNDFSDTGDPGLSLADIPGVLFSRSRRASLQAVPEPTDGGLSESPGLSEGQDQG
jgi:hypothetical protein